MLAVAILILVSLTALAWTRLSTTTITRQPSSAALDMGKAKRSSIATVIPTLTRFGFEPAEFNIPAGRCLLAVRNNSELEGIDLELTRQSGQKLVSGRYNNGKKNWDRVLDLVPGEYVLSVSGHPEWGCKIIVSPNYQATPNL